MPSGLLRGHKLGFQECSQRPCGWHDNLENAEIAALDTGPVLAAARAAGWPAAFADEPVLFLGDEPLYYLLMREDVGRNVIMLIGALA